jgi:hypothetical protein
MRKTTLLAAAVAALVLIGIGTWVGVRTFTLTSAVASSTDKAPVRLLRPMMTTTSWSIENRGGPRVMSA